MMSKRPTLAQKKTMKKWHLNPDNWRVQRVLPHQMILIHKHTGAKRIVPEGSQGRLEERQEAI